MLKKIIIGVLIAIIAIAGGGYYYAFVYMKNKKFDMENAEATSISSVELVKAFQTDEAGSNAAYLDKVLQITGTVSTTGTTQTGEKTITLGSEDPFAGVMVTIDSAAAINVAAGEPITLKGFCKGFLSDVVITNAIQVKQ
jgi:proline racemase